MTGGAVGSIFAQLFHLTAAERKTLLVAGAAAGMSACSRTPSRRYCSPSNCSCSSGSRAASSPWRSRRDRGDAARAAARRGADLPGRGARPDGSGVVAAPLPWASSRACARASSRGSSTAEDLFPGSRSTGCGGRRSARSSWRRRAFWTRASRRRLRHDRRCWPEASGGLGCSSGQGAGVVVRPGLGDVGRRPRAAADDGRARSARSRRRGSRGRRSRGAHRHGGDDGRHDAVPRSRPCCSPSSYPRLRACPRSSSPARPPRRDRAAAPAFDPDREGCAPGGARGREYAIDPFVLARVERRHGRRAAQVVPSDMTVASLRGRGVEGRLAARGPARGRSWSTRRAASPAS